MPPAFILSQDQTLHCKKFDRLLRGALFFGSTVNSASGGFPIDSGNLTLYFAFALRCSISKEHSPFSGQQDITLHPIFRFANRLAVFFEKTRFFCRFRARGGAEGARNTAWESHVRALRAPGSQEALHGTGARSARTWTPRGSAAPHLPHPRHATGQCRACHT